jgi:phosphohistidine swiveling domain-containing protein
MNYPLTLYELQQELLEHSKDGRSDVPMRVAITTDNFGAFVRYISHDKELNPTSRPHGTRQSKINDAGHFLAQAMTLVALCDIDLQEAINSALSGLRDHECLAKRAESTPDGSIRGVVACIGTGTITAKAWVCDDMMTFPGGKWEPMILVASHPEADARLKQFSGFVTDHGGMGCHAAIIAREKGVPCIAGTGNATKRIKTGDTITLDVEKGAVFLRLVKQEAT